MQLRVTHLRHTALKLKKKNPGFKHFKTHDDYFPFLLPSQPDDEDLNSSRQPPFTPQMNTLRSCMICGFLTVVVVIVVAMAIIFPVVYVGSEYK